MRNKQRQRGISLTEILVVIGVMAILMGVSIPAAKQLMVSFESSTGVRHLINAALANARAIAVREQAYAGVRFQQDTDGHTYIILIEHDPTATGLANGFRTVSGRKPIEFPEGTTLSGTSVSTGPSVVFSPAGKLTTHRVRAYNKDGVSGDTSTDTIFNTPVNVVSGFSMFLQDGASTEMTSRQNLTIIDKNGVRTTEYISPYTGELVMEYHE